MGDIAIIKMSGGAALNLKIVGGTTQPTSPAENTIWVNTPTTLNGYIIAAAEPDNPAAGLLWFKTGASASAPINIGGKDAIILYPNYAYQYIDGEWTPKTAMTYVNGSWKAWVIYLLKDGVDNTDVTGGWIGKGFWLGEGTGGRAPSVSFADGKMVISQTGSAGSNSGIEYTQNKLDLSSANKIIVTAYSTVTNVDHAKLAVWAEEPNDWNGVANVSLANSASQTYILDVSALKGEYYIGFTLYQYNGGSITIEGDFKVE